MRTLLIALALTVAGLLCNTNTSMAAVGQTEGQVPSAMLADMGLGGMQPMSDAQGMQIRGKGTTNITFVVIAIYSRVNIQVNIGCCSPCKTCTKTR